MSDKLIRIIEIKEDKSKCCNTSTIALTAAAFGIIISPTILITLGITAVAGGLGIYSLKKIKKFNAEILALLK